MTQAEEEVDVGAVDGVGVDTGVAFEEGEVVEVEVEGVVPNTIRTTSGYIG